MKKIVSLILISCLCFALCSCGAATLTGDPAVYQNANKSFSIELPTEDSEDEPAWIINEETSGDILDMTDSAETVNVLVQCLSKAQASRIAPDFESYKTYASENTFGEYLKDANLKDAEMEVPEFVINSAASTYSAKKYEGVIVFMETEKAYYTYLVVAAEGGYGANEKVIQTSILSLKEITDAIAPVEETAPAETEQAE